MKVSSLEIDLHKRVVSVWCYCHSIEDIDYLRDQLQVIREAWKRLDKIQRPKEEAK